MQIFRLLVPRVQHHLSFGYATTATTATARDSQPAAQANTTRIAIDQHTRETRLQLQQDRRIAHGRSAVGPGPEVGWVSQEAFQHNISCWNGSCQRAQKRTRTTPHNPAHVQDGHDVELPSSTVQPCHAHHPQPILLPIAGSRSCCSTRVQPQQQPRRRWRVHDCFCFKRITMARGRHCPELPVRGGASSCGGCARRVLRHKGACLLCLHSDIRECASVCCFRVRCFLNRNGLQICTFD